MTENDSSLDFTLSSRFNIGRNDLSTHAPSEIAMSLEQIDVTAEDALLPSSSNSNNQNSLDIGSHIYFGIPTSSANAAHVGYTVGYLSPYRNDNANNEANDCGDGDSDSDGEDISAITSSREISLEEEDLSQRVHNHHHFDRDAENRTERYNCRSDLDDHDHDLDLDLPTVIDMSMQEITVLQQMLDRELMIAQRHLEEWHGGSSSISSVTSSLTSSSMDTEAAQCSKRARAA